jgi:hypothetical protein
MQFTLDSRTIAAQTLLEHRTLEYVKQALRVTVDWDLESVGVERKLSSILFIVESLHRHLLRLMSLEESGGYMQAAIEEKPHLADQIRKLRADHDGFRRDLRALNDLVKEDNPIASGSLSSTCESLVAFLDQLDRHDRQETDLIHAAFYDDEGGEG